MYFKYNKCILTADGHIRSRDKMDNGLLREIVLDVKKVRETRPVHFLVANLQKNQGLYAKLFMLKREKLYDCIFSNSYIVLIQRQ